MRIAVTGANGFLGGHTVRALCARGMAVTAVGRSSDSLAVLHAGGARTVSSDFSTDSIARWIDGQDAVVHLAARRMSRLDAPRRLASFVEPNLLLVERIAEAAVSAGVSRIVFASTIAVYASPDPVPYREDGPTHPTNAYGLSKLLGEQSLEMVCRNTPTVPIILRLAALFGTGERTTGVFMHFLSEAAEGRDLVIRGNRNQGVDLLYVMDAVEAIATALVTPGAMGIYNVGAGRAWTIGEMATVIVSNSGHNIGIRGEQSVEGPASKPFMSIAKAAKFLGWAPQYDLETGLARMRELVS